MGDVPQQYWNQLLALSTRATAECEGDEKTPSQPVQMDESNRAWLETAMADLVRETDPSRLLDGLLQQLHTYAANCEQLSDDDHDKVLDLVERLDDLLGFADLCPKFFREGGVIMLDKFITSSASSDVRGAFVDLIHTICENNPPGQQSFIDGGMLKRALSLLADKTTDVSIRIKLLGAVSGMVKSHLPAFDAFLAASGPLVLAEIVGEEEASDKLAGKSARVLTSIAFTVQDCPHRRSVLNGVIARCMCQLVGRSEAALPESEYIASYLVESVAWEEIEESSRQRLAACLETEASRTDDPDTRAILSKAHKKFAATKSG